MDPYYFVYEAEKLGYHSQIILSGRKINDGMGKFVADATIKKLVLADKIVRKSKVVILGITFKENCPDIRNSKVADVIKGLTEYGVQPIVIDPHADKDEVKREYNVDLYDLDSVFDADCIILAVAHNEFKQISQTALNSMFKKSDNSQKVIIDIKSILNPDEIKNAGYSYWSL